MLFRDRLEIWNPGRLPDGFTIQKLHEVHRSEPTNPVLAHPLFRAGYIEHLGTGTTDMIADCEALGLRTPEFIQADDFRTIIYRQEKVSDTAEKVTELEEKVTERPQKVTELDEKSNGVSPKSNGAEQKSSQVRLTAKQRKVLEFCDVIPRTAQEILEMVGVKYQTKTREQYVNKLVEAGLLRPTTVHRNDSNRRYITAHSSTER
jgi:predicted HTH transcriptional regulator